MESRAIGGEGMRRGRQEVTRDGTEIASALRASLAGKVGKERYELWFGSGTRLTEEDGRLIVGVANPFLEHWLRSNFRGQIEDACLETLGQRLSLEFRVDPGVSGASNESAPRDGTDRTHGSVSGEKTVERDGADRPSGAARRRFADLGSFVTGRTNRLARAAAEMVVERPGELSPLLIHGPTGVGKTHLLEGIWTAARKARRPLAAVYLTAEQFTIEFLQALRGSGLPSFRQKYRGVELLLIDDLQFFCGKKCTLVELFYTIDTMLREGRQMVFAADCAPDQLSALGPELNSRLQGGMACRIEPADYETRIAILRQMAQRSGVDLPPEVQKLVASRLTGHARELSGAVCRLQAASRADGAPINLQTAEESLAEMMRHTARVIRLPDIAKAVCQAFGLEPASLQSGRKAKRVSHPRMLAMWLARKYTRAALSEIGDYFGRRTHSTVISAQKRVDNWLAGGTSLELAGRTWNIDDAVRQVERHLMAG